MSDLDRQATGAPEPQEHEELNVNYTGKFVIARNRPEYWTGNNWTYNRDNAKRYGSIPDATTTMESNFSKGLDWCGYIERLPDKEGEKE